MMFLKFVYITMYQGKYPIFCEFDGFNFFMQELGGLRIRTNKETIIRENLDLREYPAITLGQGLVGKRF